MNASNTATTIEVTGLMGNQITANSQQATARGIVFRILRRIIPHDPWVVAPQLLMSTVPFMPAT
jgi:hypothetical protein